MKIGIYPGSFNPWHKGHEDILNKALEVFDEVHIVQMQNPDKTDVIISNVPKYVTNNDKVELSFTISTLKEVVKLTDATGIIRGLRNGNDLQYEMNQQYWNEDVGVDVPFVYFITDRKLSHVSSSSIRMVKKLGLEHEY